MDIRFDSSSRRYILASIEKLPVSLSITPNEASALSFALEISQRLMPHLSKFFQSVQRMLEGQVPSRIMAVGQDVARSAVSCPVVPPEGGVFLSLMEAMMDRKRTCVTLKAPSGKDGKRVLLDPWGFSLSGALWRVRGYDPSSGSVKTYIVNAITSVEHLGTGDFVSPGDVPHRGVSFRFKVMLSPGQAFPGAWFPMEDQGDDVVMGWAPDHEEVVRWALASAPYVKLIDPPELLKRVDDTLVSLDLKAPMLPKP
ncbi:MAG: WYL domain-containing protein [Thermanaerothrix sp.]|nr:WYL domain-containing protein [Thermanaerothrix sp.]